MYLILLHTYSSTTLDVSMDIKALQVHCEGKSYLIGDHRMKKLHSMMWF
jgi:hypothetical protein